jgi:hypothetical protein
MSTNHSTEPKHEAHAVDSTDAKTTGAAEESATRSTLVDTVFDLGIQWATAGLKLATVALDETSKALASTANALETLAESLTPNKRP